MHKQKTERLKKISKNAHHVVHKRKMLTSLGTSKEHSPFYAWIKNSFDVWAKKKGSQQKTLKIRKFTSPSLNFLLYLNALLLLFLDYPNNRLAEKNIPFHGLVNIASWADLFNQMKMNNYINE